MFRGASRVEMADIRTARDQVLEMPVGGVYVFLDVLDSCKNDFWGAVVVL